MAVKSLKVQAPEKRSNLMISLSGQDLYNKTFCHCNRRHDIQHVATQRNDALHNNKICYAREY
jgi:hypothetical protein